jgi:aminoglycoside phosphotransferase (APT) family kinase protein
MAEAASRDSEYSGTKTVEERHRFDEAGLETWMRENVEGFAGPLTVSQFKGGQSNPTYRLDTPGRSYVMRRKPFGKLLPSAHAVDREYKVITALHRQGFPAPKTYGLCMDDGVIGAAFYVMQMVDGRVFWDQTLPAVAREDRRPIFEQEILTLAKLHSYNPDEIGLGDYGRPGNYFARQVDRWTKQYRASETEKIEDVERLIEWLAKTVPQQDRVSVVHGDYRLDNMIFAPNKPNVIAVLDWELSTLGDPLADFTYLLMQWIMSSGGGRTGLVGQDLPSLNIPTLAEAIEIYCKATGRPDIPDLNWYYSYNLFRLTCILQGIAGRIRDGTASSAKAAESAARVKPLAKSSWEYAVKAGAS